MTGENTAAKNQANNQDRRAIRATAPVRMKDIARNLGLSTVTISRVLRGHADISEKTRKRVLKRMEELNYQPNLAARALITGHS
jgi:transcriptional regulator with XRE-family HTH domain